MRRTHIPTLLLLAACAAVGCSKGAVAPEARTQQVPIPAPVNPGRVAEAVDRQTTEEGDEGAPAKITGPVSFADADAAYQAKKYSEAVTLFQAYTEQHPRNAWGHFMLGLSASKAGDPAKAESAFMQALSIDPNHVKSLVNLSRVLLDQRRTDDALVHLTHAGEIAASSGDVQRLLGRAYAEQRKNDEAADAYRRAIALDPHDAWSMNNLGLLLLEQDRADEALPMLARAVQLRMDVPAFHNNLGMALEHTGRFLAAADEYRGALTADPGYGKAKQNLARVEAVKVGHEEPFDLEAVATVGR
jgi:tetratricopeptide (TPR) repeat protein